MVPSLVLLNDRLPSLPLNVVLKADSLTFAMILIPLVKVRPGNTLPRRYRRGGEVSLEFFLNLTVPAR